MFTKRIARGRSSRRVACEQLEGRRLMTTVGIIPTMYGDAYLDGTVDTVDFNLLAANFSKRIPLGQVAAATTTLSSFVIKNGYTFTGSYDGSDTGTLSIHFTSFTHTGHFAGDFEFSAGNAGTLDGTFSGRITLTRHLFVTFNGSAQLGSISGTITGYATHTGKHITADYTIAGAINDSGTVAVDR